MNELIKIKDLEVVMQLMVDMIALSKIKHKVKAKLRESIIQKMKSY